MTRIARLRFVVGDDDTALAVGSGSLPVLGTPRLLAWCEAASCAVPAEDVGATQPGATTVGTLVHLEHLAPSAVGAEVEVVAELVGRDGPKLEFAVHATDGSGRTVGRGSVHRAVVDGERLLRAADLSTRAP